MSTDVTEATYLALVASIQQESPSTLSALAAGIMAAEHLGIADDSRSFARIFDIAHALALRALTELSARHGLVAITARDPRSQRLTFTLSEKGAAFLANLPVLSRPSALLPAACP